MSKRTEFILRCVSSGFLGFALSAFCDIYIMDWRFWAILLPVAIINGIRDF